MNYINCEEYAKRTNITVRRVQQMCKNGEIIGAVKNGKSWQIPEHLLIKNKKKLPIGESGFIEAVSNNYYVDKTMMIKDVIDNGYKVSLFIRPRRFGKTLNMNMLRTFFEISDVDNSVYFQDKNIWRCGEEYTQLQGKYPVIYFSFKDVKAPNWEITLDDLRILISKEFTRHKVLKDSQMLENYEINLYNKLASNNGTNNEYCRALDTLSYMLYKHYNHKVIIIIDEYDTPIQQGYSNGFYKGSIDFMNKFFSCGLKDNPFLEYGFMTGILRFVKESIFSGLNNIRIFSVIDNQYSSYFGFTDEEVDTLIDYYNCSEKKNEIEEWYDGYNFGNTKIYNPWSVLNYISENFIPRPYWESTSSNDLFNEIISNASDRAIDLMYKLLQKEEITAQVNTSVVYSGINNDPDMIFSFLFVTGYLSAYNKKFDPNRPYQLSLRIPNKEIYFIYKNEIINKIGNSPLCKDIQDALLTLDFNRLEYKLNEFMLHSISSFDGSNEAFYHGLILGLCALLDNKYYIKSNREAGFGRFDLGLFSKVKAYPNFIFEFKHTSDSNVNLDILANEALEQIANRRYDVDLEFKGEKKVIKIGIAFRGKEAIIKTKR